VMSEPQVTPPQEALNTDGNVLCWLLHIIVVLLREVQTLQAKLAAFEKDSTTSHKPPSSDGFKKKRGAITRGVSGRKPGGQKEHRGITRCNVPPHEVRKRLPISPTPVNNVARCLRNSIPVCRWNVGKSGKSPRLSPSCRSTSFTKPRVTAAIPPVCLCRSGFTLVRVTPCRHTSRT